MDIWMQANSKGTNIIPKCYKFKKHNFTYTNFDRHTLICGPAVNELDW
jgi:hypothetical protein